MYPPPRTVTEALRLGAGRLAAAEIDNPRLEARLLLAHALGCTRADLLREPSATVPSGPLEALLNRRVAHEPLAYILGHREFWSLDFAVSPATLIPRPDSETLVEAALVACPAPRRVLDLGTGTGCLLLAVLHERPDAFGIGTDLSADAAALAARNARSLGLDDRAAFLCADWGEPLQGGFDLVLSNPPYIETDAIDRLMPEVACHEPRRALDGGTDGSVAYRRILGDLPRLLAPQGVAVLELGADQAAGVAAEARTRGFMVALQTDLAGIQRAILLRHAPS
ncbi:MAG: peptide chain release factor N(5)-glutamine methyltransferase [Acetobacteraceae bacterium]|nr:peptide chain release factor N(5)-glutamine methyltransferase [Acetobacteraceae bacterium]